MNTSDCRRMQLECLQRAKGDPAQSTNWLGQAEHWRQLRRSGYSRLVQLATSLKAPQGRAGEFVGCLTPCPALQCGG